MSVELARPTDNLLAHKLREASAREGALERGIRWKEESTAGWWHLRQGELTFRIVRDPAGWGCGRVELQISGARAAVFYSRQSKEWKAQALLSGKAYDRSELREAYEQLKVWMERARIGEASTRTRRELVEIIRQAVRREALGEL